MKKLSTAQRDRFADSLRRLGGDCDMLQMMAAMVTEDAPPLIEQTREQLKAGDLSAAAASAHALKGMLSTFESDQPVNDLQRLIDAARAGQAEQATFCWQVAQPRINDLVQEIAKLCADE